MASKIVGYVISLIGIAAIAASLFEEAGSYIAPFLPEQVTNTYLMVGGIILLIIGIYIIIKRGSGGGGSGGKQKTKEVPIYHGKEVVGYRRSK